MAEVKVQYLTQQCLDDLRAEYTNIKEKKIPEIAKRIDDAKQLGDLSENAEYHAAKDEMAWAHGRILELTQILENAEVIKKTDKTDTVDIGSTVKFRTTSNEEKTFSIVGAQEADPLNGKISNESPIGTCFLGAKRGDTVIANTPAGEQKYEILEIK